MNLSQYRAVIFDLDGTLVNSMWIWKDIDIDYLQKHGYQLPSDLQKQIEGMSTTETAQYFKTRFAIKDSIADIKAEWIDMAKDYYAKRIDLTPGAKTFIETLKQNNIKMGIGTSNFRELAELVIKRHRLTGYFDSLRTSCEFKRGKPHPDVFLGVAADLNIDPKYCLVFEDTHAGIIAAKRAGMDAIAIKDALSSPYLNEIKRDAMAVIDDFKEIILKPKR